MFREKLKFIIKRLQDDSFSDAEAIKILYFFKAWQTLIKNNLITDYVLSKDNDSFLKLQESIKYFATKYDLFKLFGNSIKIDNLSENSFFKIIDLVNSQVKFLKINQIYNDILGKKYGYVGSNQLAEFATNLLDINCISIYAPFNNSFNIAYYTDKKIYAESYSHAFTIELMKVLDSVNIEFHHGNILEKPFYTIDKNTLKEFDCTISFPPMGLKNIHLSLMDDKYNRFKIYKGKSNLDVAHFEHILSQTRYKAIVLMPVGFTFRAGIEEEFRKYLIDENLLETIIQLPPNLHSATAIETTFFIINKQKKSQKVYFINLKNDKFIAKEARKIVLKNLNEVIENCKKYKVIDNISSLVSQKEIVDNNYSLSVERYIRTKEVSILENKLSNYQLISLEGISEIRRSQLFKDEGNGVEIYEISPTGFSQAGYTLEKGKIKQIKKQQSKYETYKLLPNDILLSTKGTIGKIAIVGNIHKPMIASQAIEIIRVKNKDFNPIVLYMFLKSNIGQAMLAKLNTGSVMPQISTKEVKQFKIPLLNKEKEQNIVKNFELEIELLKEIESIDKKIENINNNFL